MSLPIWSLLWSLKKMENVLQCVTMAMPNETIINHITNWFKDLLG
jgi:hypothetical protein